MAARKLHTIEKRMIPSSDRDIRVLILRPTESARSQENTPGILWLHGGGHLHGMYQKILLPHARLLVEKHGAVVVAPEYRTAFEKPFPADLEDCYAALLFLKAHADELGINDAQIMVGGESAGGGLTVATCLLARDLGEVNVAFQMPLYPMLDDRETASSRDNHAPVWNTRTNRFAWKHYLRDLGGTTPPSYAAPARETNYARLPPAYTYVGTAEPFYCEALEYVANLKRAGIEATVDVYPHWFHAYDMLLPFAKKSREAVQRFEERYLYATEHYFAPQEKRLFSQQPKAEPGKRTPGDGDRWPSGEEPSTASDAPWRIWRVADHPEMAEEAAAWFSAKWGIPEDAYLESMRESARAGSAVPQWYIVRANNEVASPIIAGCGIIENDFHDRPDLAPNLCALYVEEEYRHRGLARHLLDHARAETATMGYNRLYLVTDLVGFYEKCGWEYLGDAHEPEGGTIRLYGAGTCFRES